ncbi:MAG: 3'-5' exonuclease domain-containing protein 2, partial [Bdellovibrionales bacterium]|nr:3'-5' exonuclease domain-containing protein 2 [Bdellovibrionales bacterium]
MNDEALKVEKKIISFQGRIHLITSDQELSDVAEVICSASTLGFDTETRPSFRKGQVYKVALLQLSTDQDAYLIRLHGITQFRHILPIFENDKIIKAGVAIRDDLRLLQKLFHFEPRKFVELQNLAKTKGLKNFGLKGMTEEVLQATISKGPKMTNWEAPVLTDRQLLYAATDAWIGLKLYQKLTESVSHR